MRSRIASLGSSLFGRPSGVAKNGTSVTFTRHYLTVLTIAAAWALLVFVLLKRPDAALVSTGMWSVVAGVVAVLLGHGILRQCVWVDDRGLTMRGWFDHSFVSWEDLSYLQVRRVTRSQSHYFVVVVHRRSPIRQLVLSEECGSEQRANDLISAIQQRAPAAIHVLDRGFEFPE